ncbi:diacylglycerol kinase family protein [Hyphomicrobium sp. LHD-15]|uniref:diacylglycerol/lipid kinase family protein n=1 Tax=Hyphomicrobium sp. LHD-15 TaxID=3072142 RepID=UPI00280CD2C0|nr:diacylglycerol kinase family protein [Hyphomicrobium sp. LHD-15]MDQ8697162.1 diacylglycerol kinase family protein [Hyphomicrobium sp. LHD-15]
MAFDAIVPTPSGDGPTRDVARMTARAIINLRAGTALGLSADEMRAVIADAFAHHGHSISVDCLPPEMIEEAIAEAAQQDIDVLIVGGGDGTLRTAARYLMGSSIALGILPLGTMNRLAKDLEIPLDLRRAAHFLATAQPTKIDVAKINDSIFLCNSLMGTTLRYSVGRARLRGKPASERLPKYFRLIRDILSSRQKISIVVDNGTELLRLRALSVAVTNNGYDESTTWLRRSQLDRGKLTMYVSKHRNGWGLAKALLRALLGRWDGDPQMDKLTGTRFVIHSPLKRKRLANDGEISKFETPLVYEIVPRALTVLATERADQHDGENRAS